jgi:hypothetical protein
MNENNKISKKEDEIFCPECGNIIKKYSVFCSYCGTKIKEQEISRNPSYSQNINISQSTNIPNIVDPKSKITAIILIIFFGYWGWLYTYRRDSWKFWLSFSLSIVVLIPLICIFGGVSTAGVLAEDIEGVGAASGFFFLIIGLFQGAIWLWALVDRIVKTPNYYDKYPIG